MRELRERGAPNLRPSSNRAPGKFVAAAMLNWALSATSRARRVLTAKVMNARRSTVGRLRPGGKGRFQAHFFDIKFLFVNTLGCDSPLLTKKKSASPTANATPTFKAMGIGVA